MSAKMLACYLPGNSNTKLEYVAIPKPQPGQVLLKMHASGICGSDIKYIYHKHLGTKSTAYRGVIAGHEPCGIIVETSREAQYFKIDDRVVVYHISGCGFCKNCRNGYQISCSNSQRTAYGWQRDGGHSTYMVAEEKDLIKLPESLSYDDGAFISCGAGTAYEAALRAGVSGSDITLIVGLGPIGQALAMICKGRGSPKVIGVDVIQARVDASLRKKIIDRGLIFHKDMKDEIAEMSNGGAHCSFDCTGNADARLLALQASREWGRVVYIGEQGHVQFQVSADLMHMQRTLYGSWVTSLGNMQRCCEDFDMWDTHPATIITNRFSLSDIEDAYKLVAKGHSGKVVITF